MKFTIRDLLWATAVVAIALGWRITGQRTPPAPTPAEAHYELVPIGTDKLLLFNPRTGECWERYSNGRWSPHTESLERSIHPR
jgi:hypothetical protein